MEKISILLADDHEIFRNGVEHLINNEEDMQIVATAVNGLEALQKSLELQPDIVLLDISMPVMTGLETAAKLKEEGTRSQIVFFSLYDREDYVMQALRLGVKGYILKDAPNKTFLKAIRQVHLGNFFYSGDLTNLLVTEYLKKETQPETAEKPRLSIREIEILKEIKAGKSNKELAVAYNVSMRTIEAHRLNIMRKLGVKQIEAAIELAGRDRLI
ncbi:response regulator transcription factor [Bacteroidia bacterium]|nr:response regulator transcription factor [Bacteroidia bacterium]